MTAEAVERRCSQCALAKPMSEFYVGRATCKTCVRARCSINAQKRYVPRPHVVSALIPPKDEPAEKACKACGQVQPIASFSLNTGRDKSVVVRRGVCRECCKLRKHAKPPPAEDFRVCTVCGISKPKTDDNFAYLVGRGLWHGSCRDCMNMRERMRRGKRISAKRACTPSLPNTASCWSCSAEKVICKENFHFSPSGRRSGVCLECRANIPVKAKSSSSAHAGRRRVEIEVRTILDPELDAIRKKLAMAPPELESEAERLAFLRGFTRGAAHGAAETEAVEKNQDLVFRIASEARKHTYEDRVSMGYEALLACIRCGVDDRDMIAEQIRKKIKSEKGPEWLRTGMHSFGPDGDFDFIAQLEDHREVIQDE